MSSEPEAPKDTGVQKTSFVQPPPVPQAVPEQPKLTIPELLVKIYETELYLGKQQKDTNSLLTEIRDILAKRPVPNAPAPTTAPAQTQPPASNDPKMVKIIAAFADLKNEKNEPAVLINDTENTMFYIIRPNGFLGTELFAKVGAIVRGMNGEYISQGRASHFRVSKA